MSFVVGYLSPVWQTIITRALYPIQFVTGVVVTLIALVLFSGAVFAQSSSPAPVTGVVQRTANLRAGPGMHYPVKAAAKRGEVVTIIAQNRDGTWYQLENDRWIETTLVDVAPTKPAIANTTPPVPLHGEAAVQRDANLRAGPGTNYQVIGVARAGQPLVITGSNPDGSWLQIADSSWIAAFLVTSPPKGTMASPAPAGKTILVTTPFTTVTTSENDFVLVDKRLLVAYQTGGAPDGDGVHCGQESHLRVQVLDEQGNALNGVTVQVQDGAQAVQITGAQGKGKGTADFVLHGEQAVKVLRDVDARTVASDVARALFAHPAAPPYELLIRSGYCQDEANCRQFAATHQCVASYIWRVTFQRRR